MCLHTTLTTMPTQLMIGAVKEPSPLTGIGQRVLAIVYIIVQAWGELKCAQSASEGLTHSVAWCPR